MRNIYIDEDFYENVWINFLNSAHKSQFRTEGTSVYDTVMNSLLHYDAHIYIEPVVNGQTKYRLHFKNDEGYAAFILAYNARK